MKRRYHYVNDHGELFRMTETRYRAYLLAGTQQVPPNAEDYGVCVGSVLTVNKLTPVEFSDEYKAFDARTTWPAKK